ncbi:MAG: class I SAM-dependent methyltransferase [Microlunatus sp.]
MTDEYAELGEFHDLFMSDTWNVLVPALAAAFGGLAPEATIVDLGAGSGVGTKRLAYVTRAQIVAIERSLTMRAGLFARICDDPELSQRVTVLAGALPSVLDEIHHPVDGFVCAHMLGHLSAEERRDTFARLSALLAPAGVGLVTLPRDASDAGVESREVIEERWIGRHRYLARHVAEDSDGNGFSEYRVLDGDRTIRSATFASSWSMPTYDELLAELAATGLTLEPLTAPTSDNESQLRPTVGSVRLAE